MRCHPVKGHEKYPAERHNSRMTPLRLFLTACRPILNGLALLTLLAAATTTQAEGGAYRVEVLVFRYVESTAEARDVDEIRTFPHAWDLFAPRAVVYPEDPAPLGVVSDTMRSVWRRLENAADIEPLYQQTWEQSRIDYQPPIRIHDDQVLFERVSLPERWADIDLTVPDFFAPYRERYFRLDGSAQLRRSRFLHLEFNLEFRLALLPPAGSEAITGDPAAGLNEPADTPWRVPATVNPDAPVTPEGRRVVELKPPPYWNPPTPLFEPMPDERPPVPGAQLYRLSESRQIRTGELLYFDSPYLGVIARVTATAGE